MIHRILLIVFGFQVTADGKTREATQQLLTYNPAASAGESKVITFEITPDLLTMLDKNLKSVI